MLEPLQILVGSLGISPLALPQVEEDYFHYFIDELRFVDANPWLQLFCNALLHEHGDVHAAWPANDTRLVSPSPILCLLSPSFRPSRHLRSASTRGCVSSAARTSSGSGSRRRLRVGALSPLLKRG